MRVKSMHARRPARGVLGVAPAQATPAELPEGKVICPGCKKPVRYRGEGKLASTLYAHANSKIPCRFGTGSFAAGAEVIIVDLDGLLGL